MADTELVIKIPDRIHYGIVKGITVNGSKASQIVLDAIKDGTPLPKGHGGIVDIEKLIDMFWDGNSMEITKYDLSVIEPIIEADTESEE